MKKQLINTIGTALFLLISSKALSQSNKMPDRSSEFIGRPENTEPERPDADFQPSAPGLISLVDAENLQRASTVASTTLAQLPNDLTGKQSKWFAPLQSWATAAGQAATTKTHEAVLSLIPTMANYFSRNTKLEELAPEFLSMRHIMESCGSTIVRTIALHIGTTNAVVDEAKLNSFVRVYTAGYFVQEGEWEGENPPINAAGVMILDAAAVVTQLQAMPWQQASEFLSGGTTASSFLTATLGAGMVLPCSKPNTRRINLRLTQSSTNSRRGSISRNSRPGAGINFRI